MRVLLKINMIANKIDNNHKLIVNSLRKLGYSVQNLTAVKKGCPDILVGAFGKNFLFEIKDGNKPPGARKLTQDEQIWHMTWRGTVHIVNNIEDCLRIIKN